MIRVSRQGDKTVAVAFRYNPEYVDRVKTIPGRKWNPDRKLWTIPVESLPALLDRFEGEYNLVGEFPELTQKAQTLKVEEIPTTPLEPFDFKTEPRPYQVQGWNFGITRPSVLLGDDMGLGKTKQTIDVAEHRMDKGEVKRVLVIAKATLKYNWKQEIEKHGRRKAEVVDGSTPAKKLESFRKAVESGASYVIINYEQLRPLESFYKKEKNPNTGKSMKVWVGPKNATEQLAYELTQTEWDMVIMDEAHKVKNHKSRMGKAIHDIKAPYKMALTGTPIINRPDELYNLLKWLGMEKRGYWAFIKDYAILGGWSGWEIEEYKPGAIDALHRNLASTMLRRMKSDVLNDLPEKSYRTVWVDLGPQQRMVYNQIRDGLRTELMDENGKPLIGPAMTLTKILRLKQAAGSLELLGGKPISAKIDVVKELVEEIVDAEQKVLIFTQFRGMYEILKRELAEYGVVGIDGSMEPKARQDAVDKFQSDPSIRVFVGMAPACREGLTLTAASHVIHVDKEWSPLYVEQATDRCYRIGQKNPVLVTTVVARNTIDEAVEQLLEEKMNVFDAIVGGKGTEELQGSLIKRLLV